MSSIPDPAKSATLRVASAAPRDRAIAAIWVSACATAARSDAVRPQYPRRRRLPGCRTAGCGRGSPPPASPPWPRQDKALPVVCQQRQAIARLSLGDGGGEHADGRLVRKPALDGRFRYRPYQLGQDIRIEQDHSSKDGGARIASRGTAGSSTPPSGAKRARIDAARLPG